MTEEQRTLIWNLTRENALELIEAKDIGTWKNICQHIQELANARESLPINVIQFYMAVRWDFESRQYVRKEDHIQKCAAL